MQASVGVVGAKLGTYSSLCGETKILTETKTFFWNKIFQNPYHSSDTKFYKTDIQTFFLATPNCPKDTI